MATPAVRTAQAAPRSARRRSQRSHHHIFVENPPPDRDRRETSETPLRRLRAGLATPAAPAIRDSPTRARGTRARRATPQADLQPAVRERVVDGHTGGDREDRRDVDAPSGSGSGRWGRRARGRRSAALPHQVVGQDDARQRRGDVAEVRDPRLRLLDERREGRERRLPPRPRSPSRTRRPRARQRSSPARAPPCRRWSGWQRASGRRSPRAAARAGPRSTSARRPRRTGSCRRSPRRRSRRRTSSRPPRGAQRRRGRSACRAASACSGRGRRRS